MNLLKRTWARGANPIGAPGCPELAFPGISTAKQRMVLMHFQSSSVKSDFVMVVNVRMKINCDLLRRNILQVEAMRKRRGLNCQIKLDWRRMERVSQIKSQRWRSDAVGSWDKPVKWLGQLTSCLRFAVTGTAWHFLKHTSHEPLAAKYISVPGGQAVILGNKLMVPVTGLWNKLQN